MSVIRKHKDDMMIQKVVKYQGRLMSPPKAAPDESLRLFVE